MAQGCRILVVEDERDARLVLARRLESLGFEVLQATDGPSGLTQARQAQPDLIVLDVMLPGQDGMEVYQALSEDPATQKIPVIFLTAISSGLPMTEQSLELLAKAKHRQQLAGRFSVMVKPYDPKELEARIREMIKPEESPAPPAKTEAGKKEEKT